MLKALLWDVDGTLAETERDGHLVAFNLAFERLGLPWRWSETRYGDLPKVAGGRARLLADLAHQPEAPRDPAERAALVERIHPLKNALYPDLVRGAGLPLRDGVAALLDECAAARMPMAIVTTTSRANVDALLGARVGSGWSDAFATVVCAEDAPVKKPDPQACRMALARLGLKGAETLAAEDSPAGVRAARAAGVPVIVTRSHYFFDADVAGALAVGPSLGTIDGWLPAVAPRALARVGLEALTRWHGQSSTCRGGTS